MVWSEIARGAGLVEMLALRVRGPRALIRVGRELVEDQAMAPGLLVQLHSAARGDGRSGGSSSAAARESMLLAAPAFELWVGVSSQLVEKYSAGVGDVPSRGGVRPAALLLAWWASLVAAAASGEVDRGVVEAQVAWLSSLVDEVRAVLRTKRVVEVTVPCPTCRTYRYQLPAETGGAEVQALRTELRDVDGESTVTITCGACGDEWFDTAELVTLARAAGLEFDEVAVRHAAIDLARARRDRAGKVSTSG